MSGRGPNPFHPPEREMSKRKTALKHARSPKIAAKAQRAAQAVVKSPKVARRSVSEAAELTRSGPGRRGRQRHSKRADSTHVVH
jgi:hypothetical protein